MSNGIQIRQNEENSISMLAAQKQLYNEAKYIENIVLIFSVILPFLCACIQAFVKNNTMLNTIGYVLSFVSMLVGMSFGSYIKKKRKLAAFIQQKFDTYIYQMQWSKSLFGKNKNVNDVIAEKSIKYLRKQGARETLINWYPQLVDSFPIKKGILICQRENFKWDVGLRKRYKLVSTILIMVLSIIILGMGIIQDEKISILFRRMAFILPLYQWLYGVINAFDADITPYNH